MANPFYPYDPLHPRPIQTRRSRYEQIRVNLRRSAAQNQVRRNRYKEFAQKTHKKAEDQIYLRQAGPKGPTSR